MRKVLVIDTCILCVWLDVPGMECCGTDADRWDKERVEQKILDESQQRTIFVLPVATIIETGNHIVKSPHSRRDRANALADLMRKSAEQQTPWAAFSDQSTLWAPEKLTCLADRWPDLADQRLSLGDATISDVAEHYASGGYHVEILTGDRGLKAYEPSEPPEIPRRRARV